MKYLKKWSVAVSFVLMGAMVLTGCGSKVYDDNRVTNVETVNKDEIAIYVGGGMCSGNYDPCTGYGMYGYGIFHSSLLKFNKEIHMENDIATGYEVSGDGLTYTYKIRDDIRFSDGVPLTAGDVVFTYMTAKKSGSSVDLTMLEKAEAPDNTTVIFTLNKPLSTFASTTALLGIVAEHAYDENYGDNPIGSGPFKVAQLDKEQQLIVIPNEYYYGKQSEFKKITILNLDEETALSNAKSGQLDVVMVNPEYANETVDGMRLESYKTVDNRGFNLICIPETTLSDGRAVGNNVTSDIAVRKALNIGIDRKVIIKNALNGVGIPAYGRVDELPWYYEETAFEDNRVEEAKEILEKAGWIDTDGDGIREKNGIKAEFTITGRTDDIQRYNLAVAFAEDAKKLGIMMKAEAADWSECKRNIRTIPTCVGSGDYNPYELYQSYSSKVEPVGLNNPSVYKNEKVDEYIDKALEATSMEEAIKYWKKAQWDGVTGINGDVPFVWIVNIDHTYFVKNGLQLGEQMLHPHGHGVPVIANMNEWSWEN